MIDVYPSNYKKVDGVLMPFTVTQKVLTQEIVIKMTDVSETSTSQPPRSSPRPR